MRFIEEHDTPCTFRLGRIGYRVTTFRAPQRGELFILPTDSEELQEHEPQVVGACGEFATEECRHIVVPLSESTKQELTTWGAFFVFVASDEAYEELFGTDVAYPDDNDPED